MSTITVPAAPSASVSATDLWSRVVNGIVLVVVVGICAWVFVAQQSSSQLGVFMTFAGTAIAAYFGISATREVSRSAVEGANAHAVDARESVGRIQAKHDELLDRVASARGAVTLDEARSILAG